MRVHPIGLGQLACWRHRFQHLDRAAAGFFGGGVLTTAHQRPCQRREVLALLQLVARLPPQLDRFAARTDRFLLLVDNGALDGVRLKQLRMFGRRPIAVEFQDAEVLRRRCAVRADGGGGTRRCDAVLPHARGIPGARCEIRQLREIATSNSGGLQTMQCQSAEFPTPHEIEIVQYRLADQFVPECNRFARRLKHAELHAVREPFHVAAEDAFEHRQLHAAANHRRGVQHVPGIRLQHRHARHHRVPHGAWNAQCFVGQDLRDEERIARRLAVHRRRIEWPAGDQDAHRLDRQPWQLDADGRSRCRKIAEQHAQRLHDLIVTMRQDHQDPCLCNAPAEELDEIERRLVGPMDVLDHHDRRLRRAVQLAEHGGEQHGARCLDLELREQPAAGLVGYVVERTERRGVEQRIAIPLEDADRRATRRQEPVDEGCLADARFTADDGDTSLAGDRCLEGSCERVQVGGAFQQFHGTAGLKTWRGTDATACHAGGLSAGPWL